jgi:predicted nucleic acid-binding protein
MATLLDTNILLRAAQPKHRHFEMAMQALDTLRDRNELPVIVQQNIVEFWAVATRPLSGNGLGLTTDQTIAEFNELEGIFLILPEIPIQEEWQRIVIQHQVSGKSVHDARLVAAMIVHGVESILTFNVPDFLRYREISVLDPARVA